MTVWRALLPVLGILLNAAVQVFCVRAGFSFLRSIFVGFAAGFAAVLAVSGVSASLAGDMLAYGCFGYCYFHFLNLGETARRIRLVRELYESPEGLSEEELLARYGSSDILAARMKRLLGNGQLILRDGRYFTGRPAMLWISKLIVLLKLAVIGRRSEFD